MPTVNEGVHGRVNQILDCVVGSRVPVWLVCLFRLQLLKCSLETLSEPVAHERIGLDGGVVERADAS